MSRTKQTGWIAGTAAAVLVAAGAITYAVALHHVVGVPYEEEGRPGDRGRHGTVLLGRTGVVVLAGEHQCRDGVDALARDGVRRDQPLVADGVTPRLGRGDPRELSMVLFILLRLMPGDPTSEILGQEASAE
ncbi:hypothetical protein ABZS63_20700, partial [Streptomyces sp. NPDC005568]